MTKAVSYDELRASLLDVPGFTYTGGAGFKMAKTAAGLWVPVAANVAGETDLGFGCWDARQNLLTRTREIEHANWTKVAGGGSVTVTPNAIIAPDGTMTADKIVEVADTGLHDVSQVVTVGNVQVTAVGRFHASERTKVRIRNSDLTTGGYDATFDLVAKTATLNAGGKGSWTGGVATIKEEPGGWFRCALVSTKGAGTTAAFAFCLAADNGSTSYLGEAGKGAYLWAPEVKLGPDIEDPPVFSDAASATRTADAMAIAMVLAGNAPGTIYAEWVFDTLPTANTAIIGATGKPTLAIGATYVKGSFPGVADVCVKAIVPNVGVVNKAAFSFAPGSFAVTANGAAPATGAGATTWTDSTILNIGVETQRINGIIKKIEVIPRALTAAQIQALTT